MLLLVDKDLFDSAELLECFLMSSYTSNNNMPQSARIENMVLFGDSLYGKKEYRRALNVYRKAYQHNKIILKKSAIVTRCLFRDVLVSCHDPMFLSGGSIM